MKRKNKWTREYATKVGTYADEVVEFVMTTVRDDVDIDPIKANDNGFDAETMEADIKEAVARKLVERLDVPIKCEVKGPHWTPGVSKANTYVYFEMDKIARTVGSLYEHAHWLMRDMRTLCGKIMEDGVDAYVSSSGEAQLAKSVNEKCAQVAAMKEGLENMKRIVKVYEDSEEGEV